MVAPKATMVRVNVREKRVAACRAARLERAALAFDATARSVVASPTLRSALRGVDPQGPRINAAKRRESPSWRKNAASAIVAQAKIVDAARNALCTFDRAKAFAARKALRAASR